MTGRQLRWAAVSILFLSSALNYLDRMVLSALMPTLRAEFGIGGAGLGDLIAAFSLTYALASPVMGLLIDRTGLRWGASLAVSLWSCVGIATGFAGGFGSLMLCRAMLGAAESGGIPAAMKGSAVYLDRRDRALGSALSQVGITVGSLAAPILTEFASARYGWRSAFVIAGLLGLVWVPVWLYVSARIPPTAVPSDPVAVSHSAILRDGRFQALIVANVLAMTVYSLWTVWMTDFLVTRFHMTQNEANLRFAWLPPIFATLGAVAGGFAAQRLIGSGTQAIQHRVRIALTASVFVGLTGAAPWTASPALATACICASVFALLAVSVNYYSIPLDLFGADRAAFAVSFLTGVYGVMQFLISPQIGRWSDRAGWQPVCLAVAFLPMLSALLLRAVFRRA